MTKMKLVDILKNKEKYYLGEEEFFIKNKELRAGFTSIKQLEKLVLS